MARRTYTTKFRPFINSDIEVTLFWYPADPSRGYLGVPSRVNSLDWRTEPWAATGVGEVFGASRHYNYARPRTFVGVPHRCGTDQEFAEGERYDPTRPPTQYDGQQLPLCCNPVEVGSGGIAFGGTAANSVTYQPRSFGGIALGGAAAVFVGDYAGSTGGVAFAGVSLVDVQSYPPSLGGVAFAGVSLVDAQSYPPSLGGVALGGTATNFVGHYAGSTGGVAFAGVSLVDAQVYVTSTGGIAFHGTAANFVGHYVPSTGGIAFHGTATNFASHYPHSTGGIAFHGTATVSVSPPPPPPTPTVRAAIDGPFTGTAFLPSAGTGDLIVIILALSSYLSVPPSPSGWTLQATNSGADGSGKVAIFTRIRASGDPASVTFSFGVGIGDSNYATLSIQHGTAFVTSAWSATMTAPSVTMGGLNRLLISVYSGWGNAGGVETSVAVPAGQTAVGTTTHTDTDGISTNVGYETVSGSGASGTRTPTVSGGTWWFPAVGNFVIR